MKYIKLVLGTLLVLSAHAAIPQTINKIEPPNWWTGMKEPTLQIMVYGEKIGHLQARVQYKGVKLTGSSCPENENYLFLDLVIKPNTRAGNILIRLFDKEHEVLHFDFPLLDREPGSAERTGFNSSDVIYMIVPDRFSNGDPGNDNMEGFTEIADRTNKVGRHGGDLKGINQHLDYLVDMGFTALWPTPILENNMPRYSYHGYAITDFYKVDSRIGTNESYRSLCREASRAGIKIIMDMVINHCGLEHWWMKDPPTTNWINNFGKDFQGTNHRKSIQMDPYAAPEDHEILTEGWFVRTMPDLNPLNPFLGTYLIQNTIWWIEFAGISGIRMDTYFYPDENYMSEWSKRIMDEYPGFNIVGEVWHTNPAFVSFWQKGKANQNGYVSYLPALCDFPIQHALRTALMSPDEGDSGWVILYETLAQDFQYPSPENLVVFGDNHDMNRIYTQLEQDRAKLKMALVFLLTTRGIPELFYGTELLMTSPARRDDGLIRSDFAGGWSGDLVNAFTGDGLAGEQAETKEFIRKIAQWRKNMPVIHHGKLMQYAPEKGIYVFFRYSETDTVMVILNKNEKPVTLLLDRFKRWLGSSGKGLEIISGKQIELNESILLETPGPLIIEVEK